MRNFLDFIGHLILAALIAMIAVAFIASVAHGQTLSCKYQQPNIRISYGTASQHTLRTLYVPHVSHINASCPFTHAVEKAAIKFAWLNGGEGDGDFFTRAYSNVLHRWYRVHCEANGTLHDLYPSGLGMRFDCRASSARIKFHAWEGH
jgi:hypothetical protein